MHGENINFPKYSFVSLMILQSSLWSPFRFAVAFTVAQPFNLSPCLRVYRHFYRRFSNLSPFYTELSPIFDFIATF